MIPAVQDLDITATLVVFLLAALTVWICGRSLTLQAEVLAQRTGLGKAFVGVLFLGVATSQPELATTISASLNNHPALAGTNLLGGVAMQIAVLALIDGLALKNRALTHFSPNPVFLMQGVWLILLLAIAIAGITTSGYGLAMGSVDFWSWVLAGVYILGLLIMYRYESRSPWQPVGEKPGKEPEGRSASSRYQERATITLFSGFAAASVVVFASGYVLAVTASRLTELTGVSETFVGAVLVAFATSLPELSTTYSAVKLGAYAMAVGNIFGTNALELALFLPADLAYGAGSIFSAMEQRAAFIAALGIVLTCVYVWGILERRDRTLCSLGMDSATILLLYVAGMALLYFID